MSLQEETGVSGSPKSSSRVHSSILSTFSFDRSGGPKDRLLTALYVLAGALAVSLVAVYVPYGRLLAVAWASAVVFVAVFEVVRLFARDPETQRFRLLSAVLQYALLATPAIGATVSGVSEVLGYGQSGSFLQLCIVLSGAGFMIMQAIEGRSEISVASRFAEAYGTAFLLLGVCAPQLILLSGSNFGIQILWWIVAVVALNDAAAYFVGRWLGRTKMAPALSPNKTLEGMAAGLVAGILAGVLFWKLLLGDSVSIFSLVCGSFWVTIAAQAADLSKSFLKRLRGVKDTGALFPGHGGVLDRFDAMIGAAPVVLIFLTLLGLR